QRSCTPLRQDPTPALHRPVRRRGHQLPHQEGRGARKSRDGPGRHYSTCSRRSAQHVG
ncbi:hypothetical protein BN1708_020643, partial [Verticillium longisporum]